MTAAAVPHAEQIETANRLIVEEAASTVNRIIELAKGDLCDTRPDGSRIYFRAPDLTCIEYLINRTLGIPGARPVHAKRPAANDVEDALSNIAHELEHQDAEADPLHPDGPFRLLLSERAKCRADWRKKWAELDERIVQFLPTAIERLTELCSGVTVRKEANGHTRYYTQRPNRRAIEHISKRIQCSSLPIIDSINGDGMPTPDPAREWSEEEISKLTTSQLVALFKATEAQEAEESNPSVAAPELPAYYTEAHRQMANYLPTAINNIKALANGAASTIVTDEGDTLVVTHAPDVRANIFLINRFVGPPSSRFIVKHTAAIDLTPNAEPIARYTEAITKACTSYPPHAEKAPEIRTLLSNLAAAL